jgi:hypothetical protein
MPDWSDNGFYLLLGLLAFWVPVLGYLWSLHSRSAHLVEEEALLMAEEHSQP